MNDPTPAAGGLTEEIAELRRLFANSTPGKWKLWGMLVAADQDGTSNVDTAVEVAQTFFRDENGKPRTWDADLICHMQRALPALLDAAARTEAADREAARVTATVEAELDAIWRESQQGHQIINDAGIMQDCVNRLRAALSSAGTDALDRERAKAWDEGWNACFGYLSAEYVGPDDPPNPYRAAAVSPEGGGA